MIPVFEPSAALWQGLKMAFSFRHLLQGLETIEKKLSKEQKGLNASRATQSPGGSRMSRLMFIFLGGSDRFYRNCEILLQKYDNRLAGVLVNATALEVSTSIFGKEGKQTLAVMIDDKELINKFILEHSTDQKIST